MWFSLDDPEEKIYGKNFQKENIPSLGYMRVLNDDCESILFLNDDLIVGAWFRDIETLNELYENEAMKMVKILPESIVEIYEITLNLFNTVMELNEECKLSLPLKIDMFWDEMGLNSTDSREKLLSKYKINEPSEDDLENFINGYKS